MTKKFVALTMVLVLVAGVGALAAEDEERPLTGEWENTLTLDPNQEARYLQTWYRGGEKIQGPDNPFRFSSALSLTYTSGGLTYDLTADLGYDKRGMPEFWYYDEGGTSPPWFPGDNGLTNLEFGVGTSVGLLDLSSTVNFDPDDKRLDYWKSSASLTLGGVSITDTFVLQPTMEEETRIYSWTVDEETQTTSATFQVPTDTLGAGMNLMFSGETPGGVSVTVENLFGMEKVASLGSSPFASYYKTGLVSDTTFDWTTIPYATGYNIIGYHDPEEEVGFWYGPSSMQYVMSVLTLENLSLGCCDFKNETMFSEAEGFEYTEFEFTIESESLPISLTGWLTFTTQTKSIYLEPSITTDWACFTVYSGLTTGDGTASNLLAANDENESVIDGFEIRGFAITGVELGHVEFSSYTALGGNSLVDMTQDLSLYNGGYGSTYNELFQIKKLEEYPLDFTLNVYFDMSSDKGIFDLGMFDGSMEYEIDDEFTIGTGVAIKPDAGLQSFDFTFDYSF